MERLKENICHLIDLYHEKKNSMGPNSTRVQKKKKVVLNFQNTKQYFSFTKRLGQIQYIFLEAFFDS